MVSIEEQVALAPFMTFKVGGLADYFCVVKTVADLTEALSFSRKQGIPFLIIGGGSNILVSDHGFRGLVIKIDLRGSMWKNISHDVREVTVASGESWDAFVKETVAQGLYGLENLSGIPGNVGGTPIQNVGAYGAEVADVLVQVSALRSDTGKRVVVTRDECAFGYRDSFFKTPRGKKFIILSVTFRLSKKGMLNFSYKDVRDYFHAREDGKTPTLQNVRDAILLIRARKFPDLMRYGTAGSFFKNPVVSAATSARLRKRFPALPSFPAEHKKEKIPAAWLIEHIGNWKGVREHDVGSFENQALVLVNYGGATARDTFNLSQKIIEDIFLKSGIRLEREVQLVGSFATAA